MYKSRLFEINMYKSISLHLFRFLDNQIKFLLLIV
jgi:hypothetical protein